MAALLAAAAAACAGDARPEGYDRAAYEARRNLHLPGNASYNRLLHRELIGDLRRAVHRCRLEHLDTRGATLLYRLDAEGERVETLLYPESPFGTCVAEVAGGFELPPPPRPDYWLGFFIEDCPLGGGPSECDQLVP